MTALPIGPAFLRLAACCWALSAVTTLGLIFLPYAFTPLADGDTARRLLDPVYMARVWVALAHPLIVLVGVLGLGAVRLAVSPGATVCGLAFFFLWAGTEGVQQSLTLVALNWTWRAGYLQSADPALRDAMRTHIEGFDGLSDGLFFFILVTFVVANLAVAIAMWGGGRLQRGLSIGFVLAAGLGWSAG